MVDNNNIFSNAFHKKENQQIGLIECLFGLLIYLINSVDIYSWI